MRHYYRNALGVFVVVGRLLLLLLVLVRVILSALVMRCSSGDGWE